MSLALKARTLMALGLPNVARVAVYRLGLRTGLASGLRLRAETPQGPFFAPPAPLAAPLPEAGRGDDRLVLFGGHEVAFSGARPDWLANPLTGAVFPHPERHWSQIPDFDPAVGDIKAIWELSRFDWLLTRAQRARNGEDKAFSRLEDWLEDWVRRNPPYSGPNWKCGQEASIRVMHLAMAALILDQHASPHDGLAKLIALHLARIAPTISYAVAQDNNHGTSEAAALYIGGSWLAAQGHEAGAGWAKKGRDALIERVLRLVMEDGSFSQYSVNYHRVMLDTLAMAEIWRRRCDLPAFPAAYVQRAVAAARWLFELTDADTGLAPNLGANDGARLLPLTPTVYGDYRPSVQTGMALFANQRAYGEGAWDGALRWLRMPIPSALAEKPGALLMDQGGYALLREGGAQALLRYPRFKFRPSHADGLHVDLTVNGVNLLRDGGTYSYNSGAEWIEYFGGAAGHNTIQFDGRDQMPRLGRFLFGGWLKAQNAAQEQGRASASYRDAKGAEHHRSIELHADRLIVRDRIGGAFKTALLRWRLAPGYWRQQGQSFSCDQYGLDISASMALNTVVLGEGWESTIYLQKTTLPVLEAEVSAPGEIVTTIRWTS